MGRVIEQVMAYVSYAASAVFIGIGFFKLFVYKNSEYYTDGNVNNYVGGDAYNFIINASQATGYFVLATLFAIIGSTMLILMKMDKNKTVVKEDPVVEEEKKDLVESDVSQKVMLAKRSDL